MTESQGYLKTPPAYEPGPTQERCAQVARDKLLSYGHVDLAEKVEAALTAAHEAWLSETFSERWQAAKDRAAAAEAGEPTVPNSDYLSAIKAYRETTTATIERCAQVAETINCDHLTGQQIAAAIRALKDKP